MTQCISIMNRKFVALFICMFVLLMTVPCLYGFSAGEIRGNEYRADDQPSGFFMDDTEDFTGYTLFTPVSSTMTYLINNSGDITHTWASDYEPALSVYLLDYGVILRATHLDGTLRGFQKIAWDGSVISEVEHPRQHHDIEPLPNGNVLMITTEEKTNEEAIAAGRNPDLLYGSTLKLLVIVEVEPSDTSGGDVVWEWYVWDHLIQDFDPTKENYGVVANHAELADFNFTEEVGTNWLHTNSIDYNEAFDQILLSIHNLGEIWVIDHSTTTAEAAGHNGGASGKGGDLLYRWGNPQAYRAGKEKDQVFSGQHSAQWIELWCPGAGNILVLNNGLERNYASVDEIVPPVDSTGKYSYVPGSAYEPEAPIWTCTPAGFHPMRYSSAQRLPTGNTLICDGPQGYFFEVTPEQETVWEYVNPYPNPSGNEVFMIRRYYEPFIEPIPTLYPTEDELYVLDLSSMITDPDTPDENLVLTENSPYADLVDSELHLLYPPGVIHDVINLSVSDTRFAVSRDIQVEVTPGAAVPLDGYCDYSDRLYPNSPNPFAVTTAIRYDLAEPGQVSIVVYDVAGGLVRVLADMPRQGAGRHATRWDGLDRFGKPVVSGVYFCRLESRGVTATRKMVLAR